MIADVFDAPTCDRAYRQAWTVDARLASIDEVLASRGELTTE